VTAPVKREMDGGKGGIVLLLPEVERKRERKSVLIWTPISPERTLISLRAIAGRGKRGERCRSSLLKRVNILGGAKRDRAFTKQDGRCKKRRGQLFTQNKTELEGLSLGK